MSIAITALVLLRLEARRGEWHAVAELAAHMAVSPAVVCAHLEPLAARGMAHVRRGEQGAIQHARMDAEPAEPNTGPAGADRTAGHPVPQCADLRGVYGPYIAPYGQRQPAAQPPTAHPTEEHP